MVAETLSCHLGYFEASLVLLYQRCPFLHSDFVIILRVPRDENMVPHFVAEVSLVLFVVLGVVNQSRDANLLALRGGLLNLPVLGVLAKLHSVFGV